jgi:hypothetical protein
MRKNLAFVTFVVALQFFAAIFVGILVFVSN